jgi:ubiquinone/menaquinone biosynthesis C-methylase UbiE
MQTTNFATLTEATPGPEERTAAELSSKLRQMWAGVADRWAEHADYVDERSAQLTAEMLDRVALAPGHRVLELACGPGGAGLAAAALVVPGGEVVLSDVAVEMTLVAAARARTRGLTNISVRVHDLEHIDEPDASYDVVLCRDGLMLVPDPACAAREIQRVLRPGGRVALAVWGPRKRNPWLSIMFDAVSAQFGCPVPPDGIPGPFSLEDADKLAALLIESGVSRVEVSEVSVPLRAGSFEEWWTGRCDLAGPLTKILASAPLAARAAIEARAREATRPYETRDGLEFPGVALIAAGSARA